MTGPGQAAGPPGRAGAPGPGWVRGPALVYRDAEGVQQTVLLDPFPSLTIGRGSGCDVRLPWDERVSRVHAQLDRIGRNWTLVDDGLSRNGTFLNGERVNGRRRLYDGDTFVRGAPPVGDRAAGGGPPQQTTGGTPGGTRAARSPTQRQILTALCRPYKQETPYATPASNQDVAGELFLSVDAVKTHLRTLFHKFHIEDLPQNQKRAKLVERAFALGIVSRRDL